MIDVNCNFLVKKEPHFYINTPEPCGLEIITSCTRSSYVLVWWFSRSGRGWRIWVSISFVSFSFSLWFITGYKVRARVNIQKRAVVGLRSTMPCSIQFNRFLDLVSDCGIDRPVILILLITLTWFCSESNWLSYTTLVEHLWAQPHKVSAASLGLPTEGGLVLASRTEVHNHL